MKRDKGDDKDIQKVQCRKRKLSGLNWAMNWAPGLGLGHKEYLPPDSLQRAE